MENVEKPELMYAAPTFIIEKDGTFTIDVKANDYKDQEVQYYLGVSNPFGINSIKKFNNGEWEEISINNFFEKKQLIDEEIKLQVNFNVAGEFPFEFKIIQDEQNVLGSLSMNLKVVESEVEEGTHYEEIYEQFLSAVTDDRFAQMTEEELMIDLLPLLKRAIYYLCRIAKVPGFNLHNRDDINYIFMQKLTDHEIECLAWGMVVSWTEQQLNSSRLIEQTYYDAGIKTYSPNDTMRNLLTLHEDYYKRLKNRLTEYGYKTVDISQFGGHD